MRKRHAVVWCVALVALWAGPVVGQCVDYGDHLHPTALLPWAGVYDLTQQANYLYLAQSTAGLAVVDISDPEAAVEVGRLELEGSCANIVVSEDVAYLGNSELGIVLADVADPETPVLTGNLDVPVTWHGLAVRGSTILAAGDSNLVVADASSPAEPTVLSVFEAGAPVAGLASEDDRVYLLVEPDELVIIDVGDPTAPLELGRFSLPGTIDMDSPVAVHEGLVFTAGSWSSWAIDASDPTSPQLLSVIEDTWALDLEIRGDIIYLVTVNSLDAVDITDPLAPRLLGTFPTPAWSIAVHCTPDHLLVAERWSGIEVLEPGAVGAPVPVLGHISTTSAEQMWHHGDHVYSHGESHDPGLVRITTVADLSAPATEWAWEVPGDIVDLTGGNGLAFVATVADGLWIADITDPTAPVLVPGGQVPGSAQHLAVDQHTLYASGSDSGLRAIDIQDPTAPIVTAQDLSGEAVGRLVMVGSRIAVIRDDGLSIMEAGATSFTSIGELDFANSSWCAADADGAFIYLAGEHEAEPSVVVVDASAPTSPTVVAIWSPRLQLGESMMKSVSIDGCTLYVGAVVGPSFHNPAPAVIALNVSVPSQPELTGVGHGAGFGWPCFVLADHGVIGFSSNYNGGAFAEPSLWTLPLHCDDLVSVPQESDNTLLPGPAASLLPPYPSPFNPQVTIAYQLETAGPIELAIYDLAGRRVRKLDQGWRPAGRQEITWSGRDDAGRQLASGVFLVRLTTGNRDEVQKVCLIR